MSTTVAVLLGLVLVISVVPSTLGFKIISRSKRDVNENGPQLHAHDLPDLIENDNKFVNKSYQGSILKYKFKSDQTFDMNSLITLNDGNAYVFDSSCTLSANKCKQGTPTFTYNTTVGGKIIPNHKYKYSLNPEGTESYVGDIYEDTFILDKLEFTTEIGVIDSASNGQNLSDTYLGLGFRSPDLGFSVNTDPIRRIFKALDDKGVLIQSSLNPQTGYITFGATNHSSCTELFFVDAQTNNAGLQQWYIRFDSVRATTVTVTDENKRLARFNFDQQEITMPMELAKDVGADEFSDLRRQPNIHFEFKDQTIVLTPEEYSIKQPNGKYRPMIMGSDNNPGFELGTIFLKNRCLVLNGKDEQHPKIGLSIVPSKKGAETASLSAVLIGAVAVGVMQMFRS